MRAYLQLLQRETSTSSCSSVVLDSRALHNRSELVDWSRSNSCGFGESCCSSSVLSGWLVEVDSHSSLPVLVEVVVGNFVVVLDGLITIVSYVWLDTSAECMYHFVGFSKTQYEEGAWMWN